MICRLAVRWKILIPVLVLVSGFLMSAVANDISSDWFSRVWQVDDGLPAANVTGIVQTQDGYLWLSTQSGLARFDGVQFEVVPVPVGRPRPLIHAMLCDHAGNLWLAVNGRAVIRFDVQHGQAKMFTDTNGLSDSLVLQMIETPDHQIWLCYADNSVFRITPDDRIFQITAKDGLNQDGSCSLALDKNGLLWFAKGFQYGFLNDGNFQTTGVLKDRNAHILAATDGGLWFCTSTQVLKSVSNAPPVAVANFQGDTKRVKPSVMYEDFDGRLWIGTASEGLFLLHDSQLSKIEISQSRIRTIIADRENNIWVGTDGGGLNRLQPKVVMLVGRDEGLPFDTVRSMAEDDAGDLWVVTQDGALTKLPAEDWASGQPIDNWPGGLAHCIVRDRQGAMWIGTYQHGLYRCQNGTFRQFGPPSGLGSGSIRSLLLDRQNNLWIGLESDNLVQCLHEGKFISYPMPANSRAVRAMAEDAAGEIWMGTLDGRLLRVDQDHLVEVPQPSADSPSPIRCLSVTPDGSLWIGYAYKGVGRLRAGKFSEFSAENGLFDGNICTMMPDDAGRMWFASDRGIFFVNLEQFNRFSAGLDDKIQSEVYGRDAGLPGLEGYYGYWPGAITTRTGQILFPTHSGIAVVFPALVHPNLIPPDVVIQNIVLDGKRIDWQKGHEVRIPPNHRKIEITFTAPSFIDTRLVRFRYRLTGWNNDWDEPQTEREVIFARLPPGKYTFQVTACNNYGIWSKEGASFNFTVMPFLWQNWFFRIPVLLVFLGFVFALVRFFSLRQMRQIMKRMEQETALQRERTRIAQDMHDELGARFTQISLLGELSRKSLAEPAQADDFLSQISRVAQIGVKSLDEIVWAVNPRNDTLSELLDYTGQYALDFVKSAGLECRLDFPDSVPPSDIAGDIRHAIFLILKESLHNVVKHAHATRVKLLFDLDDKDMLWRVEDNGKGFESAPDNALDDGLRNIRQRAEALGGLAEIKSFPGKGTRVTVRIPIHK